VRDVDRGELINEIRAIFETT